MALDQQAGRRAAAVRSVRSPHPVAGSRSPQSTAHPWQAPTRCAGGLAGAAPETDLVSDGVALGDDPSGLLGRDRGAVKVAQHIRFAVGEDRPGPLASLAATTQTALVWWAPWAVICRW
jgi:hypothetical protein